MTSDLERKLSRHFEWRRDPSLRSGQAPERGDPQDQLLSPLGRDCGPSLALRTYIAIAPNETFSVCPTMNGRAHGISPKGRT